MNRQEMDTFIKWILGGMVVLGVLYFFPWGDITWGRIIQSSEGVVTVTGYAESEETNQMAVFTAGVNVVDDDKDKAVEEVNTKMTDLLKAVKDFGIAEEDIKTQSVSVFQLQETSPNVPGRVKPGQWSASNNVEIIMRDVDKAGGLTDVLNKSGATNVFGPSFQLDTKKQADDTLLEAAVADARTKAERMARAGGTKLGRVISIVEGGQAPTIFPLMRAEAKDLSVSAPVEVGTTKVSKTVTVVFGLR